MKNRKIESKITANVLGWFKRSQRIVFTDSKPTKLYSFFPQKSELLCHNLPHTGIIMVFVRFADILLH